MEEVDDKRTVMGWISIFLLPIVRDTKSEGDGRVGGWREREPESSLNL